MRMVVVVVVRTQEGVQKKDQRQIQVGSIEDTPADAPVASAVLGRAKRM